MLTKKTVRAEAFFKVNTLFRTEWLSNIVITRSDSDNQINNLNFLE